MDRLASYKGVSLSSLPKDKGKALPVSVLSKTVVLTLTSLLCRCCNSERDQPRDSQMQVMQSRAPTETAL